MSIWKGLPLVAAMAIASAGFGQTPIAVTINGQPVPFNDTAPRQVNGRVLVPLRGVFEQMGAYVHWTDATQTVEATKGATSVQLRIGDRIASVNGQNVTLDVPPQLIGGSTMVPLRFISEALGADVNWNDQSQTVAILLNGAGPVASNEHSDNRTQTQRDRDRYNRDRYANNTQTQVRTERHALRVALATNAIIPVTLNESLSSNGSQTGDTFTANVETNGDSYAGIPSGTQLLGHVALARAREGNHPGVIQLAFDKIRFADGTERPIIGRLTSLEAGNVVRNSNGVIMARPTKYSSNDNTVVYVGGGAGAGAVLGVLTHTNVVTDAVVGGALGYLFQQVQRNQNQAHDVQLNSGTELGVRLSRGFTY